MLRYAIALLATAALVGCENNGANVAAPRPQTELAAYAATAQYPGSGLNDQNPQLGALIEGQDGPIKIINFSNQPLNNVDVWINQSYVYQAQSVAPHATLTIPRNLFYNRSGQSLNNTNTTITSVSLQTGNRVNKVLGPVQE